MSVQASDIKRYLTGAVADDGSQVDPNSALGDYRSSTEVIDGVSENLFDNVSGVERIAGTIEYRCYCIKNTNVSDSLLNPKVWIETAPGVSGHDIAFAVETPTGGDQDGGAQVIVNESTAPIVGAGNVSSWSSASSKVTGVGVDQGAHDVNLDAGEIVFIWVRRTITAGSSPAFNETAVVMMEGDN